MTFDAKEREQMDDCRTGLRHSSEFCVSDSPAYICGVCDCVCGTVIGSVRPIFAIGALENPRQQLFRADGDGTREQMQTD